MGRDGRLGRQPPGERLGRVERRKQEREGLRPQGERTKLLARALLGSYSEKVSPAWVLWRGVGQATFQL